MARRHGNRVAFDDPQLERRELLSDKGLAPVSAIVGSVSPTPHPVGFDVFHHDGINGLTLHQHFVDRLNDRLQTSSDQATRVTQAFQVFEASYSQLPVNPPPGYSWPTATSLLTDLQNQVDYALSHHEVLTNRPRPSQRKSLKVSPLAPRALIPYADDQIRQLGSTLAATPSVPGPNGSLVTANPIPAINKAINAIFNALAETSIHPQSLPEAERLLHQPRRPVRPQLDRRPGPVLSRLLHPRPSRRDHPGRNPPPAYSPLSPGSKPYADPCHPTERWI
jgi:hypothetical protein